MTESDAQRALLGRWWRLSALAGLGAGLSWALAVCGIALLADSFRWLWPVYPLQAALLGILPVALLMREGSGPPAERSLSGATASALSWAVVSALVSRGVCSYTIFLAGYWTDGLDLAVESLGSQIAFVTRVGPSGLSIFWGDTTLVDGIVGAFTAVVFLRRASRARREQALAGATAGGVVALVELALRDILTLDNAWVWASLGAAFAAGVSLPYWLAIPRRRLASRSAEP